MTISPTLAGALIIAVPALVVAWAGLRRVFMLFLFAAALIGVGTGYLAATGAAADVARAVLPMHVLQPAG